MNIAAGVFHVENLVRGCDPLAVPCRQPAPGAIPQPQPLGVMGGEDLARGDGQVSMQSTGGWVEAKGPPWEETGKRPKKGRGAVEKRLGSGHRKRRSLVLEYK